MTKFVQGLRISITGALVMVLLVSCYTSNPANVTTAKVGKTPHPFCTIIEPVYPIEVNDPDSVDVSVLRKLLYIEDMYDSLCVTTPEADADNP